MASPFDFSSFLLTPPIPNVGNSGGGGQNASNSNTSNNNSQQQQQQQQYGGQATSQAQPQQQQPQQQYGQNQGIDGSIGSNNQSNNEQGNQDSSSSGTRLTSFDERDYGLDPSAFSNVTFQMPSFLTASSQPGQLGDGPSMVDPSAFLAPSNPNPVPFTYNVNANQQPSYQMQNTIVPQNNQVQQNNAGNRAGNGGQTNNQSTPAYTPDTRNPVYGIYGSSVISVNPDPSPFKLQLNSAQPTFNPTQQFESRSNTPDFDPKALGLPVGNNLFPQPLPGLYSSSGFDMLGVLARVVARPNPQINIGPVDTSCSFLVVDARRYDMPIVFASTTFSDLTGYSNSEIIGRNCRFLQAPDGHVAMGSRRKYTDGNAVYHLKTHIQSGKESQASIINYRKDGSPFINLVTVIPITWDTDEIAYFVGFQVDLVEQPNAILEKMKNGTYVVNYSLLPTNPPTIPTINENTGAVNTATPSNVYKSQPQVEDAYANEEWQDQKPVKVIDPIASNAAAAAAAHSSMTIAPELLEVMGAVDGLDEIDDESAKKKWNKMLLDHTGDFVHVLSLKGSFLYVSPSVRHMLGYESTDLVGKTLQSFCHPSDIVPVMRELKDASSDKHPIINLLYRFKRKDSGYVWIEAQGKLYLEQSKSRKCVILVGRERPVYNLGWSDLQAAGGLGEREFWSKITSDGMFLYNTPSVKTVIGHDADDLRGRSMFELMEQDKTTQLSKALADAASGKSVRLHHKLRSAKGSLVDVITNFYPNSAPRSRKHIAGVVYPSIIIQTNEYASEMRRRNTASQATSSLPLPSGVDTPGGDIRRHGLQPPARPGMIRDMIVTTPDASDESSASPAGGSGGEAGSDSSAPSTFSAIPSTYKSLLQHQNTADNIFDELDTTRSTSWQYELHQLKLTNKKLKEELAMLQAAKRKRKKKEEMAAAGIMPPPSPAALNPAAKSCANCGRTDSPEWRVGPSGQRSLCNACGLRWAKATRTANARQSSAAASSTPNSSSASDVEAANAGGGFLQAPSHLAPGGPFAPIRPALHHNDSSAFS